MEVTDETKKIDESSGNNQPHPDMVEMLCRIIYNVASAPIDVGTHMGGGLREEHYQRGLAHHLAQRIKPVGSLRACVQMEQNVQVTWEGHDCGMLRADIVVSVRDGWRDAVPVAVIECKSVKSSGWADDAGRQCEAYRSRLGCMVDAVVNFSEGGDEFKNTAASGRGRALVGFSKGWSAHRCRSHFWGKYHESADCYSKPTPDTFSRLATGPEIVENWKDIVRLSPELGVMNSVLP